MAMNNNERSKGVCAVGDALVVCVVELPLGHYAAPPYRHRLQHWFHHEADTYPDSCHRCFLGCLYGSFDYWSFHRGHYDCRTDLPNLHNHGRCEVCDELFLVVELQRFNQEQPPRDFHHVCAVCVAELVGW